MRPPVQIQKLETLMDAMLHKGLIQRDLLLKNYLEIEPKLIRYPSLDPATFRAAVEEFCLGPLKTPPPIPS